MINCIQIWVIIYKYRYFSYKMILIILKQVSVTILSIHDIGIHYKPYYNIRYIAIKYIVEFRIIVFFLN